MSRGHRPADGHTADLLPDAVEAGRVDEGVELDEAAGQPPPGGVGPGQPQEDGVVGVEGRPLGRGRPSAAVSRRRGHRSEVFVRTHPPSPWGGGLGEPTLGVKFGSEKNFGASRRK